MDGPSPEQVLVPLFTLLTLVGCFGCCIYKVRAREEQRHQQRDALGHLLQGLLEEQRKKQEKTTAPPATTTIVIASQPLLGRTVQVYTQPQATASFYPTQPSPSAPSVTDPIELL
jgi:hypothetical protein